MSCFTRLLAACSVLGSLTITFPTTVRSAEEKPAPAADQPTAKPPVAKPEAAEPPQAKPAPKKELSAAQTALRDRVRRTLAVQRQQTFNTRENTVADVANFCLAFGCEAEVQDVARPGQKLNGITCLCWNVPCGGYEALMVFEGHLAPRVGFGYQEAPSQIAAVLALSRVPEEYPARVGDTVRTVADLLEHEKLTCRADADLSRKLIALSYYVKERSWKNSAGEEWSIERMAAHELERPAANTPNAGIFRVLGLSCALERQARLKAPVEGEWLKVKKYVQDSYDQAFRVQNADGSWGRATSRDVAGALTATAPVLEWLAISLPAERLEEPQMQRSVEFVDSQLSSQRYRWNVQSLSSREIGATMRAAHALVIYDQRVFQPADPPPAPAGEKPQKVAKASGKR
jgi:hypothetical protein